ncbi:adenine nucleotide alpha hydrolase family protein [archaeon]|nr:adenine nucleotide alpha hydrolase family protein [archaeon]
MKEELYCSFCDKEAVINLKPFRVNLCSEHFSQHLTNRVKRTLLKYKLVKEREKVLVAISGGKDSATLLHIMHKLSNELNFEVYGLHLNIGVKDFSEKSEDAAVSLFKALGIKYKVVNVREFFGLSIPEISKKVKKPICSTCGLIKRYIMNYVALYSNFNKIATGHNLDDIFSYIVKSFLVQDKEQLSRISVFTPTFDKLISRIKPLAEISENETLTYATLNKLPVAQVSCPFKNKFGLELKIKYSFIDPDYKYYPIKLNLVRTYSKLSLGSRENDTLRCKYCGIPTSSEVCSFCKLLLNLNLDPVSFHKAFQGYASFET